MPANTALVFSRNSGTWVFIGDIYEKMISDGLTYKTAALVMHGLATLRPGAIEVLGVPVPDAACVQGTSYCDIWKQSVGGLLNSDPVAFPVFLRATQRHTTYIAKIDRMFAPYDFNAMSILHGPLLRISDMNTIVASQRGHLEYSRGGAGLYSTPDYNIVRFVPAARDPGQTCRHPHNIPHWIVDDFTRAQAAPEVRATHPDPAKPGV